MRRNALLVVLSLSVAVPCPPALAQSRARGRKKEPPRVLKVGDEVKVWLDPNEILRDPKLEKAGVVSAGAVVVPACRQDQPNSALPGWQYDLDTHDIYVTAGKYGDKAGIDRMLAEGRALRLPVGTKVLVLSRSTIECRARVVEGGEGGRIVEIYIRYLN